MRGAAARQGGSDVRRLGAALLSSVSSLLPVLLAGALAVQINADMPAGQTAVATAVTISFAVGGLSAPLAGRMVDRIGWERAARAAAVVTGGAMLGAALAGPRPLAFGAAIAVAGFGIAIAQPASNLALLALRSGHRRGALFGLKQATSPAASLLAGVAVPAVALTVGWRWAFAAALVFPVAAALTIPGPRGRGVRAGKGRHTSARPAPPVPDSPVDGWRAALIQLSLAGALAAVAIGALSAFTAPAAVEAGHSEGAAGLLIALGSIVGICVRIGSGALIDRRGSGAAGAFAAVTGLLVAGVGGYVLLGIGTRALVVVAVILAYGGGWSWPGLFHYAVVTVNSHAPGRATGMIESGLQLGTASGPILFALLSQRWSLGGAWSVMAATSAASAVLIWLASRRMLRVADGQRFANPERSRS